MGKSTMDSKIIKSQIQKKLEMFLRIIFIIFEITLFGL